jgi:hypothetical protein
MKMYQALSGAAAQKAVLRAVARDRLSAGMLAELEDILADYKKAASQRNNVIHGQWEISAQHPDELVWYDSGESLLNHSEFWAGYNSQSDEKELMEWIGTYDGKPIKYLLYNERDFDEVIEKIRRVFFRLLDFVIECQKLNKATSDKPSLG